MELKRIQALQQPTSSSDEPQRLLTECNLTDVTKQSLVETQVLGFDS